MQDAYRLHTHYLDTLQDRRKECVQLRMMYNRLEMKIYSEFRMLDCKMRNPCITKSHQAWAINLRVWFNDIFCSLASKFHHLNVTVCWLYIFSSNPDIYSALNTILHTQLFSSQFCYDRMSRNLWFPIHFKVRAEIEF